jgi:hypothetical protein
MKLFGDGEIMEECLERVADAALPEAASTLAERM